jgi:hypothetical protein
MIYTYICICIFNIAVGMNSAVGIPFSIIFEKEMFVEKVC